MMSDLYNEFLSERKDPITEESYPSWLQNKVEELKESVKELEEELKSERKFEADLHNLVNEYSTDKSELKQKVKKLEDIITKNHIILVDKDERLKELEEREKRIRKFWDCSEHDFEVIATGKGTFESRSKTKKP